MNKGRNRFISTLILVGDFFLFYFSLYLALFFRNLSFPERERFTELQEPFIYLFFIWVFLLFVIDFYELSSFKRAVSFLRGAFTFSVLATMIGTVYFYFQPQLELTPRAVLFLAVVNFTLLSSFWRYLLFLVIGSKNFRKKVFFVGFCEEIEDILKENFFEYEVIGVYTREEVPQRIKKEILILREIEELQKISENVEIIVFTPRAKEDKETIKKIFTTFPLNVKYMEFFNLYEEATKKIPLYSVNEWWFLENVSRPQKKIGEIVNRLLEIFFSLFGLVLLFIFAPFIALLIKLDSRGPVFYRQKRVGRDEKIFVLYKFRTMHCKKEEKDVLWRENKKGEVTRVGRALRETHLDELPQIYNILKGDLGFVGPRPEAVGLAKRFEKEIPFYKLRYLVRPGITGWAQINFPASRSIKEAEEKFKYDLYYIKNRSFFLDLIILLKTLRTFFQ